VEHAYRTEAPVNGRGLFYAVLRREYPRLVKANTAYQPVSVLGAWVSQEEGQLRLLDATLQLDSGSGMGISVAEPFAALALDGRVYVLAEYGQYEGSERTVLELRRTGAARVLPPAF
jgi:hypothetical protein